MKTIERCKKGIIGIGTFLLTIPTKVFAVGLDITPQPAYGVDYPNVARIRPIVAIWRIVKTFIIPVALVIGLIIYFKKSKSSKKKKIIVTLITIAITALIYFIANKIIYELY